MPKPNFQHMIVLKEEEETDLQIIQSLSKISFIDIFRMGLEKLMEEYKNEINAIKNQPKEK